VCAYDRAKLSELNHLSPSPLASALAMYQRIPHSYAVVSADVVRAYDRAKSFYTLVGLPVHEVVLLAADKPGRYKVAEWQSLLQVCGVVVGGRGGGVHTVVLLFHKCQKGHGCQLLHVCVWGCRAGRGLKCEQVLRQGLQEDGGSCRQLFPCIGRGQICVSAFARVCLCLLYCRTVSTLGRNQTYRAPCAALCCCCCCGCGCCCVQVRVPGRPCDGSDIAALHRALDKHYHLSAGALLLLLLQLGPVAHSLLLLLHGCVVSERLCCHFYQCYHKYQHAGATHLVQLFVPVGV
jgi:hypothetical protein